MRGVGGGRGAERAVLVLDAVGGEGLEGGLEARGLVAVHLQRCQRRVHRTVQDQAAHPVREESRVRRAEEGAVRGAHVVQLLVAEDSALDVHVTGGVDRGDMREDPGRVLLAALREALERRGELLGLARVVRGLVDLRVGVHLLARKTFDGLAAGHSARVHGRHVVAGTHRGGVADSRVALEVVDRRAARAARVHQQGADPLSGAGGLLAGDGELDVAVRGLRVVERHLHRGALESGGAAGTPRQFLAVVLGQIRGRCGLRCPGRTGAGRRGPGLRRGGRRATRRAARNKQTGHGQHSDRSGEQTPEVHSRSVVRPRPKALFSGPYE